MAQWTGGSLRAGQKIRNSQGGDLRLSKVVELNGNYRLFFPTFIDEYDIKDPDTGEVVEHISEGNIRAAVVPGRTGDYEVIGTGFIPYTDDMYNVDPITEKFVDTTALEDWSRIARVLFEAQCAREKKNAEAEAERAAKEMGRSVDVVALTKKIEDIEQIYHGGKSASGENINPDKSPALSSSIVFKVSTRVLVVKMSANDEPDWKNAKYAVLEVSKARTDELLNLLNNKKYFRGSYLEVGYSYTGATTKEAGKNAKFQGIVLSDSLEELFPNEWKAIGQSKVQSIATGTPDEQVAFLRSRNRSFRGGYTPNDIISAYKKWCSTNQAVFGSIDFTNEVVARAATLFLENHLVDSMPNQLEQFKALTEQNKNNGGDKVEQDVAPANTPETIHETIEAAAAEPTETSEAVAPEESKPVDDVALANAMSMFASGSTENQTLRDIATQADGIDISAGDGDLGEL